MSDNKRAQVGQDCHVEVELIDDQNGKVRGLSPVPIREDNGDDS